MLNPTQVSEQKSVITMLTVENKELHVSMQTKEREHKLLEEQIYEFVDDMGSKEQLLASFKDQVSRSVCADVCACVDVL